jgi:hypothetical protein
VSSEERGLDRWAAPGIETDVQREFLFWNFWESLEGQEGPRHLMSPAFKLNLP